MTTTETEAPVANALREFEVAVYASEIAFARQKASDQSKENRVALASVLLSTIVGGSVFASIAGSPATWTKIVVGIVSLTAACLAAVNQWARFAGHSSTQSAAAHGCGNLRTDVIGARLRLELGELTPEQAIGKLETIRKKYKDLLDTAPSVPTPVYQQAAKDAQAKLNESVGVS